ncbi:MAG: HlyD family efflux transporter periplasmic adaptor subunit [Magnetococcus sp. YQC-5]
MGKTLFRGILLMVGWLMVAPLQPLAHEGEDHDDKQQIDNTLIAAELGSAGQGEHFEVVITPDASGGTLLFLADIVSNTPVKGAVIEVESSGVPPPWKGAAESTRQEGIYRLAWTPPADASVDLTLVVTVGEKSDLLLIRLDAPGSQKKPDGKGRMIPLSKAVQFLLQINTSTAASRNVADTLRLVGRVIPDPSGHARIQPSMPSRIAYDPDLPPPVSGQWVKQGESLAVLTPLLTFGERNDQQLSLMRGQRPTEWAASREMILAPIDGQITDVHIVPGEVITESTILAEIVNPRRLRVEAILYDLAQANRIVAGIAKTRIYPDRLFDLKLVGVSPKVNMEHQGLHVQFAVEEGSGELKIGMPVDVYATIGSVNYPVAIPRSAVTERGGIPMVWVKTSPEWFGARMIRMGRQTVEWVEILEGITPGDQVVTQGQNQLTAIR